jgi:hypothetical protein
MSLNHLEQCDVIAMGRKAHERGEDREPPYGATDERSVYWRMGWEWAADLRARRDAALAEWTGHQCST